MIFMILRPEQQSWKRGNAGFTLIETLIAVVIFGMLTSGLIFGYVQSNRMAEWSSMSLAAQSYASEGLELARSAQWNSEQYPYESGPGTGDELQLTPSGQSATGHTNYSLAGDTMDVPTTGSLIYVTNNISVTNLSLNPPLRQIRSDCVWTFPLTGIKYTNTVITLRAPDQ